ncbi:MAG: hypothetical protein QM704_17035 [Anaeromyxobacteraceae bacterium]
MVFQTLNPSGRPLEDRAALRRALTAVLRRRGHWLKESFPDARTLRAARLLPIALHASFERGRLRADAPGVAGMRWRRSWPALARSFDLPPPFRAQRGAPLVEAVLAAPVGDVLELLVLVMPGTRLSDVNAVAERAHATMAAVGAPEPRVEVRVLDAARLGRDAEVFHRLALCGTLLAGGFSVATWAAIEAAARVAVDPAVIASLATTIPAPLAALALTLISSGPTSGPLSAAARLLRRGVPARRLADPSVLAASWAAEVVPRHREALERAVELAHPDDARPRDPFTPPGGDAAEVLALARELSMAAAAVIRRTHSTGLGPNARDAWREAIGAEIPRALLPALRARLLAAGSLATTLERRGAFHEVRLGSGVVLGRGATPVQARVRALTVLAQAVPEPMVEFTEPPWRALVARLAQRRERGTLLLVVEPAVPSGPPFDPLNRGPARLLGFPGALAVTLAPGRRPSARVLTADQAVDRLVREALHGGAVEVVPARSEAHPVAARLAQLAALAREGAEPRAVPVALEAGGRVLVPRGRTVRRYALDPFTVRPRAFLPDPDAPDLALAPGERRPFSLAGPSVIECRAQLVDELRAAVLYADAHRGVLRELVFVEELEEHLRESRAVLQQADPNTVLAVRLSEDVEPAVRRLARGAQPVAVAVRGRLPHDLEVEVGGERYGGHSFLRWRHAAAALVDRWPKGERPASPSTP